MTDVAAIIISTLGVCLVGLILLGISTQIRYRITPSSLEILIFGLPVRRIRLQDIDSVSKRRPGRWCENWANTSRLSHRALLIRRKRGLRRQFVITPRNRYVFKADLERAIQRLKLPEDERQKISIISD